MASFGGVTCSRVSSEVQAMRETSIEYTVPGLDGHGFQRVGKRGRPHPVRCILYGNRAAITAFVGSIQGLQSSPIVYENDFGITSSSVWMEGMSDPQIRPAIGEGDLRCEIVATVRPVA